MFSLFMPGFFLAHLNINLVSSKLDHLKIEPFCGILFASEQIILKIQNLQLNKTLKTKNTTLYFYVVKET